MHFLYFVYVRVESVEVETYLYTRARLNAHYMCIATVHIALILGCVESTYR